MQRAPTLPDGSPRRFAPHSPIASACALIASRYCGPSSTPAELPPRWESLLPRHQRDAEVTGEEERVGGG